jgi:hypothetical protein
VAPFNDDLKQRGGHRLTDPATARCSAPYAGYAVAEIGLQGARIVPLVGQREAAGVPQHVRVRQARRLLRRKKDF